MLGVKAGKFLSDHVWIGFVIAVGVCVSFNQAPAQDFTEIWQKRCGEGQGADDYPDWQFIANNARRTADDYATDRNPNAMFTNADVEAVFQLAGEYAGEYLVMLVGEGSFGTSFAVLRPNFEFCTDPSSLDDSRSDLFSIVKAKLNGKLF